ncbi:MAG: hypothetical protein ACYCWA_10205 [Thiobacillus sp.]
MSYERKNHPLQRLYVPIWVFHRKRRLSLTMRADLMAQLRLVIEKRNWTQFEAAQYGVSVSRAYPT